MNITFFIPQLFGGGAEHVVATLCSGLSQKGHSIFLFTVCRNERDYLVDEKVNRIVIEDSFQVNGSLKNNMKLIKTLRRFCKANSIDVLVGFLGGALYAAIFATLFTKTKSVISIRNNPDLLFPSLLSRFNAKFILPLSDGCVFQTYDAQQWFPKRLRRKSTIILNPIGDVFYKVNYCPIVNKVVTCGRLNSQKNHKMLIDAFASVHTNCKDARLDIYGDGPLREDLVEYIKQLGLEDIVSLRGATNDVPAVLSSAAAFVLSSDVEGAPNALMEAMAIGVPCISTDCPCGGPKMLLGSNEYGILVPMKDSKSMSDSIIELLNSSELRQRLSNMVRQRALHFRSEVVSSEWAHYLEQIISHV